MIRDSKSLVYVDQHGQADRYIRKDRLFMSNAMGYQTELDLDTQGLVEADLSPETLNVIRRHDELLQELDGRTGQKTRRASRNAYQILFGEAWVRRVLDGAAEPEEKDRKAIMDAIAGKVPKDVKVADPGVAMSLDDRLVRIARTGRCSQEEFARMSLSSARDKKSFVESREPVPAGTMGPDHLECKAVASWALGGPKP